MYRISIDYFILNVSLFSIGVTKVKDCNFYLSVRNTMAHDEDTRQPLVPERSPRLERKSSPIESTREPNPDYARSENNNTYLS